MISRYFKTEKEMEIETDNARRNLNSHNRFDSHTLVKLKCFMMDVPLSLI